MSGSDNESPRISFDENDKRPWVVPFVQKPKFHVGDKVFMINPNGDREGPYFVASVPSAGKCTLCDKEKKDVKNGEQIDMDTVEAA